MSLIRNAISDLVLKPTGGWKRHAAVLVLGVAIAGGFAAANDLKPDTASLTDQTISVHARPISSFDKTQPDRVRFGALEFRGGAVLTSPSSNFGGWSGLVVSDDGQSLLSVSDAGTWLKADLTYAGDRVTGLVNVRIGPLKARDGKTLRKRRDRDAESIVLETGTLERGTLLMAFEQNDRIGRFPLTPKGVGAPTEYLTMPPEAKAMRMDGFESVAVVRGGPAKGAIVAIAEAADPSLASTAWLWTKGKPARLSITGAGGFNVTDVKSLDSGDLLLLERRFRWTEGVKMRLSLVPGSALKAGASIAREVLAEADLGQEIDNMEGLAVHKNARGETILTLISDDNFNKLFQRTVLLQFAFRPAELAGAPPAGSLAAEEP